MHYFALTVLSSCIVRVASCVISIACLHYSAKPVTEHVAKQTERRVHTSSNRCGAMLGLLCGVTQASLGVVSLILQRATSKGHINTISNSGNTALDCTRPGGSGKARVALISGIRPFAAMVLVVWCLMRVHREPSLCFLLSLLVSSRPRGSLSRENPRRFRFR